MKQKKSLGVLFLCLCISLICGVLIVISVKVNLSIPNNVCLFVLGILYIAVMVYLFFSRLQSDFKDREEKRYLKLIVAAACSVFFILIVPLRYHQILKANILAGYMAKDPSFSITALDEKNEASQSSEIWLDEIRIGGVAADFVHWPPSKYQGWRIEGTSLFSNGSKDDMKENHVLFQVPAGQKLEIALSYSPVAGKVLIENGEYSYVYDLYDEKSKPRKKIDLTMLYESAVNAIPTSRGHQMMFYVVEFLVVFLLFYLVAFRFFRKTTEQEEGGAQR